MKCQEFGGFMMDYLDGMLPVEMVTRFEAHLEDCPNCIKYLDSYKLTVRLGQIVGRSVEEDMPGEMPEELVTAILDACRS